MVWDESVNGDLSNDQFAPTSLVFGTGLNRVVGPTGNPGDGTGVDRDHFSFTVPTGVVWNSLTLLGNTAVSGGVSFIGIQPGSQVTVDPTSGDGQQAMIGFGHYGNNQIGSDLLPALIFNYSGSLPSGTYSIWVQDT